MASTTEGNTVVEPRQPPSEHETEVSVVEQQILTGSKQSSDPKRPETIIQHQPNPPDEPPHHHLLENGPKTAPVTESFTVWALEVIALVLSIGTVIAIVLVLNHYDGKQQPNWQGVSLNSCIAWLSTLAKTCLLFSLTESLGQLKWAWFSAGKKPLSDFKVFDSASRGGVLGSLEILWRVKGIHFVAVGGLASILALGFDPFIQNLLHYVQDSIESPTQASYLGSSTRYNVVGPLIGADYHYVDPALKANVYNSLFNVNATENWAVPTFTCTTGNCTWDPIATLAFRPACSNVTAHLNKTCGPEYSYPDVTRCNITLGTSGPSAYYRPEGSAVQAMDVTTSGSALVYSDSLFPVIQYVLAVGSNNNADASWDVVDSINNKTQFIATECALELVVRSIQANITEGSYHETTLAEYSDLQTPNGSEWTNYRYILRPPWNQTQGQDLGVTSANQTFGVGYEAWNSINSFINAIFTGSVRAASDTFGFSSDASNYATSDTLEALFYGQFNMTRSSGNSSNTNSTSSVLASNICTDQLSCAVVNVAAAMSKTLRDAAFTSSGSSSISGANDTSLVSGHTMITVPFVRIQWQWLVLPLLVWVLTCLVWAVAVFKTRRGRIYKWTNNPLPLLFLYKAQSEGEVKVRDSVEGDGTARGRSPGVEEKDAPTSQDWTETGLDHRAGSIQAKLSTQGHDVMLCD